MTKQEAAIVSAYTGFLCGEFNAMHEYIEKVLDRPVFTHELSSTIVIDEIHKKTKSDFCNLMVE